MTIGAKMSKKNKNFGGNSVFWQSDIVNSSEYLMYQNWILSLAMNRFKWENLPATCDERYLELTLTTQGMATIAKDPALDQWVSTQCTGGLPNIYDDPISWQSVGNNGWSFDCSPLNGVIVYDNIQRYPIWLNIEIWAAQLANYDRALNTNVLHQNIPWVFSAPQEKVNDLVNIVKQAIGGEPAILGYDSISNIEAKLLTEAVPFKGEDIQSSKAKLWNEIYTYLGISNVDRKSERMIESEVSANDMPTIIRALDGLNSRRRAAKYLNDTFGLDIRVYFNKDNESDNYNWTHNITEQLRSGLKLEASTDDIDRSAEPELIV